MKTLYLLRHAKSSWADPDLRDCERPLSGRGRRDVPQMGERFTAHGRQLQCLITSTATRAATTAHLFARHIGFPVQNIVSNPELYLAGSDMLIRVARLLDDRYSHAMLVGHNPAVTEFTNLMACVTIDNVPTCGLVCLGMDTETWRAMEPGTARLLDFEYPKKSA